MSKYEENHNTDAQHYVPKSYLKRWMSNDKHRKLFQYDRLVNLAGENEVKRITHVQACCEPDFYVTEDGINLDPIITDAEKNSGNILRKICHGEKLDYSEKMMLSPFIVSLMLRTRKLQYIGYLRWLKMMNSSKVQKDIQQHVHQSEGRLKYETANEEVLAGKHDQIYEPVSVLTVLLNEGANMIKYVTDMSWSYVITDSELSFCTSDTPVFLNSKNPHDELEHCGLKTPDVELVFPINPKHAILLSNHNAASNATCVLDDNGIVMFNEIVFNNSFRYVYSDQDMKHLYELMNRYKYQRCREEHMKSPISPWTKRLID